MEIGSLEIFRILRIFSSGISIFCASTAGSGSCPFPEDLARNTVHLVDRFDHVHGNADGTRLIGDGTGNGLTNPPGRVSRKLVSAPVFEFIHRFHQADIAFLNQIEELQSAIGVFFGNGNHQPQIGFRHFALGAARLRLAGGHAAIDFLEVLQRDANLLLQGQQVLLLLENRGLDIGPALAIRLCPARPPALPNPGCSRCRERP